jgi:hypothetical protein
MPTQRTVDGAPAPQSPDSTLASEREVPERSARRATARRAGDRRAQARQRKDDLEGRILEYLKDRPRRATREGAGTAQPAD